MSILTKSPNLSKALALPMSILTKSRYLPKILTLSLPKPFHHLHLRHLSAASAILSPDSSSPLTSKEKSRAAIDLLKSESNPAKILDICRAASLTPDSRLDRAAFSIAVEKLSSSKNYSFIRDLMSEMKDRPDLRNEKWVAHSIVLFGQAGMIGDAIKVYENMGELLGVERTVRSFNALLFACVLAGKYDEVNRVFVDLRYEVEPDLESYNWVIKGIVEAGKTGSGYSVLNQMRRNGIRPNATTFGYLISGFYREEKVEDVGKVLNLMEECGMKPELGTYNVRVQSLCKLGKSFEAKALVDGMVSRGMKPNCVTYNHLIHGFCKEGNLEEAKRSWKSMVNRGCKPDADCYFTLVYFLCRGGHFETALGLCKESMEKSWFPNFTTMKLLAEGLISISKVVEAREIITRVKEKFPKAAHLWNETEEKLPQ